MNLLWEKNEINFDGHYKDGKRVTIYFEYEVKRNLTYLFTINSYCLGRCVKDCIQDFINIWCDSKFLHEGNDIHRIIDDQKLKLVNSHINTLFKEDWCPKGVIVRNIKIKYLI